MDHKYGEFDYEQLMQYKEQLHKKIFWLLIYKDPETKDAYEDIDYDKYFRFLMKRIDGLNSLMLYPPILVELMSVLEAAFLETRKYDFNYQSYRKLILDAQHLVDKIWEVNE